MQQDKIHTCPDSLDILFLDSKNAFETLTYQEQIYTYTMYKASWASVPIIADQVSEESLTLLKLIYQIFTHIDVYKLAKIEDKNIKHLLNYFAIIISNCGNYAGYGDTKVIPNMEKQEMKNLFEKYFNKFYNIINLYEQIADKIFSLENNEKYLGYFPDNITTYFSSNITKDEVNIIDKYIIFKHLEGWNTRATKETHESYCQEIIELLNDETLFPKQIFIIKISSVEEPLEHHKKIEIFENQYFIICYKDHKNILHNVVEYIELAQQCCANDIQTKMLECYVKHFKYGNIKDHKQSQIYWVKDKMPNVEVNIGFIENYRDPSGIRSEFEAFVSIVNKEKTIKFKKLVDNAEIFINLLPWSKDYEKEHFSSPDFTSLDVLTFVSTNIPAGINIPNYDDIRQKYGFKNVILDNVISGNNMTHELPKYLSVEDGIIYNNFCQKSFTIDVAGHELFGHGSGKLFKVNNDGSYNFDRNKNNQLTGKKIETWYQTNETWSSKFNKLSSSYEECRAECVGLYLSCFKDIYDIFDYQEDFENIRYTCWLWMIRTGILSVSSYDPKQKQWLQAHSRARYVIYKVLKESGVINIEFIDNSFIIQVNKDKIMSDGFNALKTFLIKLHIYKSIADIDNATKLYSHYDAVDEESLKIREIYLNNKIPKKIFIQPTLQLLKNGKVKYKTYNATPEDLIQSFIDKKIENLNSL